LAPRFADLRVERVESTLRVTEAEPLAAYAYSLAGLWAPADDRQDALRRCDRFLLDRHRTGGIE
jgi:hypothetical protein